MAEWCCANYLRINPDKAKPLLFGVTQLLFEMPNVTVPFLGQGLTSLSSTKDMCVILNSNIPFNDHVSSFNYSLISTFWYLYSRGVLYKS